MANYTGLHGKGIQSLTPGTTLIDVLPTTYPPRATIGEANPPNWYHIGLLRFGSSGFFQPAFPIDADNMWVPVPPGADEVAYSIMTGGVVTIEETSSATTVPNYQKQPWDRNSVISNQFYLSILTPTGGQQTVWSYTVPASRVLRAVSLRCELKRIAAATTPGTNYTIIQVGGINWTYAITQSNTVGDTNADYMQGPMDFPAGSVLTALVQQGDTGGGSMLTLAALNGYTFDA